MPKNTVLIYDTETTGIPDWKTPSDSDTQPHIVEIGALLFDLDTRVLIKELAVVVKPEGWVIPEETIEIHGITQEQALEFGIPEKEAIQKLLDLKDSFVGCQRVAFNKTFDQRIVRIATKRFFSEEVQEDWSVKDNHHCAMIMAKKIIGGKNPKLVDAYKYFIGEEMQGAHNALSDAKAAAAVYFACLDHLENNK